MVSVSWIVYDSSVDGCSSTIAHSGSSVYEYAGIKRLSENAKIVKVFDMVTPFKSF
jgi:hypothetical protein